MRRLVGARPTDAPIGVHSNQIQQPQRPVADSYPDCPGQVTPSHQVAL
jgi:hypothetical protein